jgi:hypothetical protein
MGWFDTANTLFGAATTAGGMLPGVGGLISTGANLISGGVGTARSTDPLERGVNAAGTWGSLASLPAAIMGVMPGVSTGVGATTALGSLGAGATSTGAAMAGGAAAGGAVLGAGAAGFGLGTLMSQASDSDYTRTGAWGTDEQGRNQSALDWGSSWGTTVDNWIGTEPGDWSVPGAIAAGAGGIVSGIGGAAHAGWNALTSW